MAPDAPGGRVAEWRFVDLEVREMVAAEIPSYAVLNLRFSGEQPPKLSAADLRALISPTMTIESRWRKG